jgi:hypothetical protein
LLRRRRADLFRVRQELIDVLVVLLLGRLGAVGLDADADRAERIAPDSRGNRVTILAEVVRVLKKERDDARLQLALEVEGSSLEVLVPGGVVERRRRSERTCP